MSLQGIHYSPFTDGKPEVWKTKGDSWLEVGVQGEPIICAVCLVLFYLLFFSDYKNNMFILKNSNI